MNELLARVWSLFVAPAPRSRSLAWSAPAPSVALLCSPVDALAVGAQLTLAIGRVRAAPAGLLCLWGAGERAVPAWSAPALGGARRTVAALAAHDLGAEAGGRLVRLCLPEEPEAAFAVATRAAAVSAVPAVTALAGPRTAALDQLLTSQDLVVVAHRPDADRALAALACEGLASLRVPAVTCPVAPGARGGPWRPRESRPGPHGRRSHRRSRRWHEPPSESTWIVGVGGGHAGDRLRRVDDVGAGTTAEAPGVARRVDYRPPFEWTTDRLIRPPRR